MQSGRCCRLMRSIVAIAVGWGLLAGAALPAAAQSGRSGTATPAQPAPVLVPDQYIVTLKDSASGSVQTIANQFAARYGATVTHVYELSVRAFSARISSDRLAAARA